MVAEKPSLAETIAKILSGGRYKSRKGRSGACSIHEYSIGNDFFMVTSVCGHVFSVDFHSKFNNWNTTDPAELFNAQILKLEANPKLHIKDHLKQEAKKAQQLILWLDCDKEGENICFEVIDCCSEGNPKFKDMRNVHRAHFSALTDHEIKKAFNTLIKPNLDVSKSVDARQELDLRIGCAFTRFQTMTFQGKYGDLDSSCISYGPCQTPTLAFNVARHDLITTFKPESYNTISAYFEEMPRLKTYNTRGRIFDTTVATCLYSLVKDSQYGKVTDVVRKQKTMSRPQALNTVELLKVASSGLNIGPHAAMQIAERLYTRGFISYPRTETTHYSASENLGKTVSMLANGSGGVSNYAQMCQGMRVSPKKGKDCGDHPPITPCRLASHSDLSGDDYRVYEFICLHFLATLSEDMKYQQVEATIDVDGEFFTVTSYKVLSKGFTSIMTWRGNFADEEDGNELDASDFDNQIQFDLVKGANLKVKNVSLDNGQTSPPGYLTESELISLMEKHGIGTDASIPVHINNIQTRNYVELASGRRLIPTALGIMLIHGFKKVDFELIHPRMRSEVEKQLDLIGHGRADYKAVLNHTLSIFQQKFHYFTQNIGLVDQLFETKFTTLASSGRAFTRCGKCSRYLKLIEQKPPRLYCQKCEETFNLPTKHQYDYKCHSSEATCPLDGYGLIIGVAGGSRSLLFCPYCYNNPPFEAMQGKNGGICANCQHKTCKFSQHQTGVVMCMVCNQGVLVLDKTTTNKKHKLVCSNEMCLTVISVFKNQDSVKVLEKTCDKCKVYMFSSKPDNKEVCIFCDLKITVKQAIGKSNTQKEKGKARKKENERFKPKPVTLDNFFI